MNKFQLMQRQRFRCTYCFELFGTLIEWDGKQRFIKAEVDHILARVYSLDDSKKNLAMACDRCNNMKNDKIFWRVSAIRDYIRKQRKQHDIRVLFTPTVSNEEDHLTWALEYSRYLTSCPINERIATDKVLQSIDSDISLSDEVKICISQNFCCYTCNRSLFDYGIVLYAKWNGIHAVCKSCKKLLRNHTFSTGPDEARHFISLMMY